ncbi:helix-turn-helix transcriptional regulator [Streptomyces sp. E11-3]|uniref:helix-turn-helix domain-containing protein n=1 Tax=Streptomyces sp. E11-3 TaxID=3110112 RepID=UPI0039817A23
MRFNRPVKSGLPEERRRLAETLREGAQDCGLTADQIAKRAHASKGAISQAMSGTRVPSKSLFRSIVKAIGHDPFSPQWVALYLAALAAVLAWITLLTTTDSLHAGTQPEPPAMPSPTVRLIEIKEGAKLYTEPTGNRRADKATEQDWSDQNVDPRDMCIVDAGDAPPAVRRFGVHPYSVGAWVLYVDEKDLVIPPMTPFSFCAPPRRGAAR